MLRLSVTGGILAVALIIGTAIAPAPTLAAPANFNWTGFYIGGNVGGGWGHDDEDSTSTNPIGTLVSSASTNPSGVLGGGQIGLNYEFPTHVVLGVEADIDWTDIKGTTPTTCSTYASAILPSFVGTVGGCGHNDVKLDEFGTLRARLGYAWDYLLLYGTGGWAWGRASNTNTTTCVTSGPNSTYPCNPGSGYPFTGGVTSYSDTLSGWVAGAGIEWGFRPHWTLRLEYLHLGFGDVTSAFQTTIYESGQPPFTTPATVTSNMDVDIVRVGVSYLFR